MTEPEGQPAEPMVVDSFPTPDETTATPENLATSHETSPAPENPAHPVPEEDPEEHLGDVLKDPWDENKQEWSSVEDDHENSKTFREAYEAEVRDPSEDVEHLEENK